MRHRVVGKRLGRNSQWRKATVRDIAKATLTHQRVCTTITRAKEARKLVDQLITLGKKGTLAHKRKAFSILNDHKLVSELFKETTPRFKDRNGGYTRIIRLAERRGDNAQLAYLELTEKDRVIISKSRSEATSKAKAVTTTAEPSKKAAPEAETKNPKAPKAAPPVSGHAKDDKSAPKAKKSKNIVGGIKKIFRNKTGE